MKIFDFNIHLTYSEEYRNHIGTQTSKASASLNSEAKMEIQDYNNCLREYREDFKSSFTSGNFMFFNSDLSHSQAISPVLSSIKNIFPNPTFTALFDYRLKNYKEILKNINELGFHAIKFHPYAQEINNSDWDQILQISKYAEELKLKILICTSYGTSKMHQHDGIGLACRLADYITKIPLVLLHSGGIRAYEAFLLAEDKKNIYLDNSPKWDDFAFIFKKLGAERILYGSDFPYVSFQDSIKCMERFFDRYKFSEEERNAILYENSISLFSLNN